MGGLSRKHIVQGCEASLRRLGMDVIDLYQVHRFDPHTPIEEMLSALDLLVRQGKVRYIGASSTAAWQFAQSLSASERHGWARFVTMQNHYNLLYREEEREMMPLCEAEGVAVIPWSPLARGLLAGARRSPTDAESTTRAASDDFARKLYDQPGEEEVIDAVRQVAQARGVLAGAGGAGVAAVEAGRRRPDRRRDQATAPGRRRGRSGRGTRARRKCGSWRRLTGRTRCRGF